MRRQGRDECRSASTMGVDWCVNRSSTCRRVGGWKRRSLDGAVVVLKRSTGTGGWHRVSGCREDRQGVRQSGLRGRSGVARAGVRGRGRVECSHEEQCVAIDATVGRYGGDGVCVGEVVMVIGCRRMRLRKAVLILVVLV